MPPSLVAQAVEAVFWRAHLRTLDGAEGAERILRRLVDEINAEVDGSHGRVHDGGRGDTTGRRGGGRGRVRIPTDAVNAAIDAWRILAGHSGASALAAGNAARRRADGAGAEAHHTTTMTPRECARRAEALLRLVERAATASRALAAAARRDSSGPGSGPAHHGPPSGTPSVRPDGRSYNMVVDAHGRAGEPRSAEAALRRHPRPTAVSYNAAISAWGSTALADTEERGGRRGAQHAAERAEAVLAEMIRRHRRGDAYVRPNAISHTAVIAAWARRAQAESRSGRGAKAAVRAERALDRLVGAYSEERDYGRGGGGTAGDDSAGDLRPNVVSYSCAIAAWAHSGGGRDAAVNAEGILRRMVEGTPLRGFAVASTTSGRKKQGAGVGWGPQDGYESDSEGGESDFYVDTSFDSDSDEDDKERNSLHGGGTEAGADADKDAEELLHVSPNAVCFNACIDAWSKSPSRDAPLRAEVLLEWQRHLYDATRDEDVRPNAIGYTAAISAWSRSGDKNAAERAEALLRRMIEMCEGEGDANVRPSNVTWGAVIEAWAKSRRGREGAERAEELLTQLMLFHEQQGAADGGGNAEVERDRSTRPTEVAFNSAIDAWAKSGERDAPRRAEALMRTMWRLHREGGNEDVRPSVISYNSCLNALSKSSDDDAVEHARRLVQEMISRGEEEGEGSDLIPDTVTYTLLINVVAKSPDHENKAAEARRIVVELRERAEVTAAPSSPPHRALPNVMTYNAVLQACSLTRPPPSSSSSFCGATSRALRVAVDTFDEMMRQRRTDGGGSSMPSAATTYAPPPPNQYTYGAYLGACASLVPPRDDKTYESLALPALDACREDGVLSDAVLRALARRASHDAMERWGLDQGGRRRRPGAGGRGSPISGRTSADVVGANDLPARWIRNVTGRGRGGRRGGGAAGGRRRSPPPSADDVIRGRGSNSDPFRRSAGV